ncbi:DNA repair protein RecO [Roseinatronobacter sp. S2]|nr:DNA repair protein RecO [Roseinatronobacter sp. S2]
MDWRDQGILLSVRKHGEATALTEVFTALHGRHAGAVRGGASRKMAPVLQQGAQLDVHWRARLEDQMGNFTVELLQPRAAHIMGDRLALLALGSVCALCRFALPERAPYPGLYSATVALLDALGQPGWLHAYVLWELHLLEDTGFGLDLDRCAVTGAQQGLAYVSPRTGRAVTIEGAGEYAARLLPLPAALLNGGPLDATDLTKALAISGYFLSHRLAHAVNQRLPEARARFVSALD